MAIEIKGLTCSSLSDVAEMIDFIRQTLWRWRQDGKVPPERKYRGRQVIYTTAEPNAIEQFANRIDPVEPSDKVQRDLFGDQ
jgi:predicted site-specific integrase-resolvase